MHSCQCSLIGLPNTHFSTHTLSIPPTLHSPTAPPPHPFSYSQVKPQHSVSGRCFGHGELDICFTPRSYCSPCLPYPLPSILTKPCTISFFQGGHFVRPGATVCSLCNRGPEVVDGATDPVRVSLYQGYSGMLMSHSRHGG